MRQQLDDIEPFVQSGGRMVSVFADFVEGFITRCLGIPIPFLTSQTRGLRENNGLIEAQSIGLGEGFL